MSKWHPIRSIDDLPKVEKKKYLFQHRMGSIDIIYFDPNIDIEPRRFEVNTRNSSIKEFYVINFIAWR